MESFKLGELVTFNYGKSLPKRDRVEGAYPVMSSAGVTGYHNNYLIKGPGIIVGRKGSIGTVYFEERDFYPIDTCFYLSVNDESKLDFKYLYYMLIKSNLKDLNSDAAVPGLNRDIAYSQVFKIPKKKAQLKIVEILDAYDNLIENNNRRIAILEDMAQSLYREWFVHFRFPGHQDCQFKDSELGRIPEGWEVKKLKEVCNLTMGQSPKSEFYNEEGDGMPFFQGVRDFGLRFPTQRVWCSKPTRFANKNDILFSVRAPVGRLNIAGIDLAIGRGLCAISHKQGFQSFLYQQLKAIFTSEDMMGNGAIFNSVTKADMEGINLLCPDKDTMKIAEDQLKPIFRNLDLLCSKNKNLENQRDLLLPKLISGKINI